MDPTEGSSLPPDSITSMDALSTRHPNVTTENDSEVPNKEPSLSTLDLATSAPIVESTGEISVPPEMDTVAPKVGDSVQTHPSSFDAGADSSLNGHASITAETNGVAVNGVKEAETLQTTNGVHFDQGAEEEPNHHENLPESGLSMGTKKKKKSKKKPKSQRGLNAPTGFEEYYVDVPLTPEEYSEERDLYDMQVQLNIVQNLNPLSCMISTKLSLSSYTIANDQCSRIETAIQRYRAKRNMNSDKRNLFDKWLTFGGVDSSPRQFTGGLDPQLLADSTAEQIAAFTAVNFVNNDMDFEGPDAKYEVDFDGVVKSFLSSRLDVQFDVTTKQNIEGWCNIIRNFMNYLLHHDVCPEYNHQIYAARNSCIIAAQQIWSCHEAITSLPGDFSMACSTLFGGFYYDMYNPEDQLAPGSETSHFGMSKDRARNVFEFGLTAHCDEKLFNRYQSQVEAKTVSMESLGEQGLEIIAIEMPGEDIQNLYANLPKLEPSGVLRAKSWKIPGNDATRDLTPEEREAEEHVQEVVKEYDFWIEESVLKKLFIGMKFVATVREMSFGVLYMDNCLNAFCSFFEVLPNEMVLKFKPFRYLEPRAKQVYDEEQGNGETGQALDPETENDKEEVKEQEQTVDEELEGKEVVGDEQQNQTTSSDDLAHNDNGNRDASQPEAAPQKWHYEEINGELCFVPYESDDEDDDEIDDDDKMDTWVNNRTSVTAYDPWMTGNATPTTDAPPSNTECRNLNPDTDPYTMKLDTYAKPYSPDPNSDPETDDDEPRLGEYLLEPEESASTAEEPGEQYGTGPKTPAKISATLATASVEADDNIDISPLTEKQSARVPPEVELRDKVEELQDNLKDLRVEEGVKEDVMERVEQTEDSGAQNDTELHLRGGSVA